MFAHPRRREAHHIGQKRKLDFRFEIFDDFCLFFGVEKQNVLNRLKHVLPKFRTDPSHVRGFQHAGVHNPGPVDDRFPVGVLPASKSQFK